MSLNANLNKVNSILERKLRSFLQGPKKGETFELRNGLVSQYKHERKDSIQRVIQAMTLGKDVSSLFPDVLKNIATYDLQQKKLVYLYLMNYAKTHPELCILAVNTFVQDTEDPNPLIRALAIRTMGCIRVDKMVDYMEIPLQRTLSDENPYVRKTAAICVGKLFDLNPQICLELGFLEKLQDLLKDSNPMVVVNALNALYEIKDMNTDENLVVFEINHDIISSLILCLNECTEWGRITILTTLNDYQTQDLDQVNHIIERVIPQLQHVNPSVVLSSIKVILNHIEKLPSAQEKQQILKKLSAPLVSLVNSSSIPEAQYIGLKNIRIILEKYPEILSKELRIFFLKYSDPLYLKLEKLEIMIRLTNESNSLILLNELKEYAMEFEPSLVTKAIKSIGSVAIQLNNCVNKAVTFLNEIIEQRNDDSLIINESIIVLTNILRRYPRKNDFITLIIPIISNHIEQLNINESISSYIYLLGEYPKYFSNLQEKLTNLVEDFLTFDSILQLNILTTIVKVNLQSSSSQYSSLLQQVLEKSTKECENADVRDKAYIYWRLLSSSSSVEVQKRVVLSKVPAIKTTISSFNPIILTTLMQELSTLSSVYHKPAKTFIDANSYSKLLKTNEKLEDLKIKAKHEIIGNAKHENLLDFDEEDDSQGTSSEGVNSLLDELNDLFSSPAVAPVQNQPQQTNDIMSLFNTLPPQPQQQPFPNTSTSTANKNVNNDLLDLF
ncbi:AP-1 complex subunit beta-1 [Spathaspora sp. JA1]|nr:AP-1 complex subunit beta-1 [Spathaspora sp. JA1]